MISRPLAAAAMVFLLAQVARGAIGPGQTDTFEDGTLLGWDMGPPAPSPTNEATGGPAGMDDNFLRITSDAGGAGEETDDL